LCDSEQKVWRLNLIVSFRAIESAKEIEMILLAILGAIVLVVVLVVVII